MHLARRVPALWRWAGFWQDEDAIGRSTTMGVTDKIANKAEEMKGQAKQHLGKGTDNEQWQAEGKVDEAKGDLKQAGEKVKDVFK
jgi:uncharacterized protein YjbJ (UPF0337 family)